MKTNIILSAASGTRKAPVALLASLLSPGLGQMYCGGLSRGVIYASSLFLTALMVPLGLVLRPDNPSLHRAVFLAAVYFTIIIICHADAALSAKNRNGYSFRRYNAAWAYALYCVLSLALQGAALAFVITFYSAAFINTDSMDPSFRNGELAILAQPPRGAWKPGDAVAFRREDAVSYGRIIAIAGDRVGRLKGRITVNGVPLSLGIFLDRELSRRGITDPETVFYEVSGNRKYPVLAAPGKGSSEEKDVAESAVAKESVMIAFDNRMAHGELIQAPVSSLRGRLEGVIWPGSWRRLLLLSHYPL